MLKRLKLHRFRHIKPGTELMFTEHFNVLLGRNGTGKTMLLGLISMVLRSDFSALRNEDFDIEYEFSHEQGTGLVRFENKSMSGARAGGKSRSYHPHVFIKLHPSGKENDDDLEIDIDCSTVSWRTRGDAWEGNHFSDAFDDSLLDRFIDPFGDSLLDTLSVNIPFPDPRSRHKHLLIAFSPSGWFAYRFDEGLELFDSITEGVNGDNPSVLFDSSKPRRAHAFIPHKYEARREPGKLSAIVALSPESSLAKFPMLAGFKDMSMSLAVNRIWQEPDGPKIEWGNTGFFFSVNTDVVVSHNGLSYGQKRLLAFLYYLDANPKFVIADDLVNGMHYDWIRACLDEIGDRQAFLTSQNPLLLDYLPLESIEQVEKCFIQCRAEVVGDKAQLVWSNLAHEDAEELFADYKVGIQQVGEILRARGLW